MCEGLSPSEVRDPDLLAFVLTRCTGTPISQTPKPEAVRPTRHTITKHTNNQAIKITEFEFQRYEEIENACNSDEHLRRIAHFTACGNQPLTSRHLEIKEFLQTTNEADVRRLVTFYVALGEFNKKRLREFFSHHSISNNEMVLKESAFHGIQASMLEAARKLLSREITWGQYNELRATAREMSYNLLAYPLPPQKNRPDKREN